MEERLLELTAQEGNEVRPSRRMPIGAEVVKERGVHFRVWAPKHQKVSVVFEGAMPSALQEKTFPLVPENGGYFAGFIREAAAGMNYHFRLGDAESLVPDPASRFQPDGPHGPSQIVDPSLFEWSDAAWGGVGLEGQVIYEMHVGTFTREGTWAAAARELDSLARLGITVLEVMPVADFPGTFGWGYDGVNLFAPTRLYGTPDDFRRFVNDAHRAGLGVILDVVYNHLGPDGNYLKDFSEDYFTDRYKNDWGEAVNFDGAHSGPVREFFLANAACWIEEFHLDGLRLDATQQIFDASTEHIVAAITRAVRKCACGRRTLVVGENEPQESKFALPVEQGGFGMDALWNDDFHHTARVALTGHQEAYYTDYRGAPQEFISAAKRGYLYQGQWYRWQKKRRGKPTRGLQLAQFVHFLENHDQVANSLRGERLHRLSSPGRFRALTALLLLGPQTPMLFQGQEFGASSPFLYFAHHDPELAELVSKGRKEFLAQFPTVALPESEALLKPPGDEQTFLRCKLDLAERNTHAAIYALHYDLLKLRREDPVFRAQGAHGVDGAVLGSDSFLLRLFAPDEDDRLLLFNLERDLEPLAAPEPLLAPPEDRQWTLLWSSEHVRYGGNGALHPEQEGKWRLPGQTAVVLAPARMTEVKHGKNSKKN
jgi:maltooligosyltrehalose trehalohydrolase